MEKKKKINVENSGPLKGELSLKKTEKFGKNSLMGVNFFFKK